MDRAGGPNDYRDKFRLPTAAKGLKNDNLGKRTIGHPQWEATRTRAKVGLAPTGGRGLPDPEWRARYPRKVRWLAGCIMIAATLRQTAAPVANVKSEIHMA